MLACDTMLAMPMLDPDDARPPYAQVVDSLRREIDDGTLRPGAKLAPHKEMAANFGVSVGTVKRALGELQGAGLVISRQGQGTFVRTRRSLIDSVPNTLSADALAGLWVTCFDFHTESGAGQHVDVTKITAQSHRRIVATNYLPEPRTEGHVPAFRNEIEAQLANRHIVGYWRNTGDTRYFGALHLAVQPGEDAMDGFYTGFANDVKVDVGRWRWARLDQASLSGVELGDLRLRPPSVIAELLESKRSSVPLALAAIVERDS